MKHFLLLFFFAGVFLGCKKNDTPKPPPPPPPPGETDIPGLVSTSKNFPSPDENFTLTFDPSRGNAALNGYSGDVFLYAGVITGPAGSPSGWKYLKYDWNSTPPSAARMTRQSNGLYTIEINPRSYFNVPSGEIIQKIALLFRTMDGNTVARNKDGSDIFLPLYQTSQTNLRFSDPEMEPTFIPKPVINLAMIGQEISVSAVSSQATSLSLSLNGVNFATASNATNITGKVKITMAGQQNIKVNGGGAEAGFSFVAGGEVQIADLPSGAKQGVTFMNSGTSAVFALFAPGKAFVNVIGDFNAWAPNAASFMKRTPDGNIWWVQIDNLDPNHEYAYQYLVDGTLKIADPYCEEILDPDNDKYIPVANDPDITVELSEYPTGKTTGIVSSMKANRPVYNWKNQTFARPAKKDLVIYELLLRDFMDANNYTTLKDTVGYLSRLGVNAVELLPITEFEGNLSWGYNPIFYFAPDKYYGTKTGLQAFIDECHSKGIAVIMDMVLNHSFGQSPMVQLYFDQTLQRPALNSPWFNAVPTHPYNVGYDFNHESAATKTFVKNVLKFWMQEYRVDGFRFDLSKGFTQTNYGTSDAAVAAWSGYDAGRVAIWKDYNNFIKSVDPNNFYVILEHFAADTEEKELAAEGMMMWNNLNATMNEASMGWLTNSNFFRGIYTSHGFPQSDGLVTYMESHDEERMMFKNITYGNASGTYNVKDLITALKRQEMAAAFLFGMPGPKMIWQFGELGYDISINQNGRTGEKPVLWTYNTQPNRLALRNAFTRFINIRKKNNIFNAATITYDFSGAVKFIRLTDGSNTVVIVGNFDVNPQTANVNFGASGNWYDLINANALTTLAGPGYSATLAPGEYHIFSQTILNE
jgi:1,4-alpha-glucan branching enzyme